MKPLFKNYNFGFNKNEKKVIVNFCKQAINQMSGNEKFQPDIRAFNSIIEKLNSSTETVKFTKDEKIRLVHQIKQNRDYLQKQIKTSWFFKKWLYRSLLTQYESLLSNHFDE